MLSSAPIIPGLSFETVQPELRDALPRMDIASFVGFASSGPLHTPVAVESVREFRDIFGADLSLAWNAALNRAETSYLGRSVEAYFRNGGRRCWIVRVADESLAQTAKFSIPGLIQTDGENVEQAYANARSPGNWAQRVSVNTILQVEVLPIAGQSLTTDEPRFSLAENSWYIDVIATSAQVSRGDLVKVNLQRDESVFLLIVESIEPHSQGARLSGTKGYLYTTDSESSPPEFDPDLAIPMATGLSGFLLFKLEDIPSLVTPTQWPHAELTSQPPSVQRLSYQIITSEQDAAGTRKLSDMGFAPQHTRFWGVLPNDENLFRAQEGETVNSYPEGTLSLVNEVREPRFPLSAPDDADDWHFLPHGMDLFLNAEKQNNAEFAPEFNRLQREGIEKFDAQLFLDPRLQGLQSDTLLQEANSLAYLSDLPSRQKLRGLHSLLLQDEATLISVPDAIHCNWSSIPPAFAAPLVAPSLDSISEIDTAGEYRISWSQDASEVEVSKSVVAYTLEWSSDADFADAERVTLAGESLARVGEIFDLLPEPPTDYVLAFSETCPTRYYFRVRAEREGEVSTWSNNKARMIPESNFLDCRYAQVSSLELLLSIDQASSPALESTLLCWNFLDFGNQTADYFEVQRSSDRLFSQVVTLLDEENQTDNPDFSISGSPDSEYCFAIEEEPNSTYYYRVRSVLRETLGPWSNTLTLWPSNLSQTSLEVKTDYSNVGLLAIHRVLLRSCFARGDLFGVLSLPSHYQVQDVLDHYALLKPGGSLMDSVSASGVQPLSVAEDAAASHAALYYPWVVSPSESNGQGKIEMQTMPPEGPIVGKLAARAIADGAWIAPANSPLTEVLALTDQVSDTCWVRMNRSRVNVIRKSVDGFAVLSANTLSDNSELREINVRRLMSLLRRLALREGDRYVFEPNNAAFQERVQQHFETVFAKLFARGAFSGATASQAYRVVTDTSVNTRQSNEAGRIIVELWVAPSNALKFIKVRLTQSGPSQLQVQEV